MKPLMMIGMRSLAFPAAFGLVVLAVNLSTAGTNPSSTAPAVVAEAPV